MIFFAGPIMECTMSQLNVSLGNSVKNSKSRNKFSSSIDFNLHSSTVISFTYLEKFSGPIPGQENFWPSRNHGPFVSLTSCRKEGHLQKQLISEQEIIKTEIPKTNNFHCYHPYLYGCSLAYETINHLVLPVSKFTSTLALEPSPS